MLLIVLHMVCRLVHNTIDISDLKSLNKRSTHDGVGAKKMVVSQQPIFVNLKSNTMKNTVQMHSFKFNLQTNQIKSHVL